MTQVKIKKSIIQEKLVDIEFPYYYQICMDFDFTDMSIFGKVEENKTTTILVDKNYTNKNIRYEVQVELHSDYSYYDMKHRIAAETFNIIKQEALEFLQKV